MSVKFLSCGGAGCSPSQMISGLLNSETRLPEWRQFADREIIFTHQGRYAISAICQLLNIGSGHEVIVPAYNCGAEVDPFVWTRAKVVFFRVDSRGNIDVEDIIRRVTPLTRMIYITHYFGWPQEIRELGEWCKQKGLCLIEDCALSLFSTGPNNSIGRIGDAAIYSFVKSLPVPDGGALVLSKNIRLENKAVRPPGNCTLFFKCLPLLKHWFMHNYKFLLKTEITRNILNTSWLKRGSDQDLEVEREMPLSNYFDEKKIDWTMSGLTKGILSATEPDKIVAIRRRNYQCLYKALNNISSIQLLFDDLPKDVCPLSFPFYVKDRNHWCKALEGNGILVGGWPSYHREFDWGGYPEARHLKNDLLTLPVHQSLEEYHMEYIAKCAKLIAEES